MHCALVLLLRSLLVLTLTLLLLSGAPSPTAAQPQCAARLPTIASLAASFSTDELAFLTQILPKPTIDGGFAVRTELRAPLHIPCQMKAFPHLQAIHTQQHELPQLTISSVAQPPHLLFFDASDRIVHVIPIAPAWTLFQLRDMVLENLPSY